MMASNSFLVLGLHPQAKRTSTTTKKGADRVMAKFSVNAGALSTSNSLLTFEELVAEYLAGPGDSMNDELRPEVGGDGPILLGGVVGAQVDQVQSEVEPGGDQPRNEVGLDVHGADGQQQERRDGDVAARTALVQDDARALDHSGDGEQDQRNEHQVN